MNTKQPKGEPISRTAPNFFVERIEDFEHLFPEAFTEGKIDFDKLKTALGEEVDGRPERYSFAWAGKKDALRLLQVPSRATLVPAKEESLCFDTTGNIFVEGDNLEVFKILWKPCFGQVKLIYIDPPYNTGADVIYQDDYSDPLGRYLTLTVQRDLEGNLLVSNPETSGRYHSTWLSMMYPRLFFARQLLRDDGVIFVSIDNTELANLRLMMNEIFGEENFLGCVVRATGTTTGQDSRGFGSSFDYLVVYSKSTGYEVGGVPLSEEDATRFSEEDAKGRYSLLQLRKTGRADRREDRPAMYYPTEAPDGTKVFPIGPGGYESRWRCGPKTYEKLVREDLIEWKKVKKDGKEQWVPYVKYYLEGREKRPSPLWIDLDGNKKATIEVKELLGERIFDNPKPTALIKRILQVATETDTNDIVLDFFAGSCTTAHSVLELNREDGGNRRFIMVQLPEPTPEDSIALKAGYNTIAEIGKERIRRIITKMNKEAEGKLDLGNRETPEDLGFKVFKLAESNYRPWKGVEEKDPEAYAKQMELYLDPLVDGWKEENVIYELALKEGYSLTSRIEKVTQVIENNVLKVTDDEKEQSFFVCLDDNLKEESVKSLTLNTDSLFVCRDKALNDELAANLALQCNLKVI
jgi:adenine-specific DNA-methyltransferase